MSEIGKDNKLKVFSRIIIFFQLTMDKSRISRNYNCNIHTDQKVISACLWPNCYRPVLCLECIKDADIHPIDHNKIVSLEEFFTRVDQFKAQNIGGPTDRQAINEVKTTASQYQQSVKSYRASIELEKKMVEETINALLTCFVEKCHKMRQDICQKLDDQVEIYAKNYRDFVKSVKKSMPVQDHNLERMSSFETLKKSATYNQIEELVKEYRKDMGQKSVASKEADENIFKLRTVAQTLQDHANKPCSTSLTNSQIGTVKTNLEGVLERFLDKYSKMQNENFPLEVKPVQAESKIIRDQTLFTLLKTYLKGDYKEPIFDLLYRGSRDGFSAKDFYNKCRQKGPTLIIIRTLQGKKFGGYTDADWVDDDEYRNSKKSFLFSLDHQEKYAIKKDQSQYAIKGSKSLGPCFGGGHDLRISVDFRFEECSGYIGFSYDAKGKFSKDIYGDTSFYIEEIEAFKVLEGDDNDDDEEEYKEDELFNKHFQPQYEDNGDDENESPVRIADLLLDDNFQQEHKKKADSEHNSDDWIQIDEKDNEEEKEQAEDNNGDGDDKSPSISSLVTYRQFETIADWIDTNRNFTLDLLYKGSQHGFRSETFHRRCDKKGSTLTLIKSKKSEQVFGGFTKQSWDTSDQPAECKDTFLFSATKKKKFPPLAAENAIFRSSTAGPVFGDGDLYICSDCNKRAESYSNLGIGYNTSNMEDSFVFFANEQYFIVDEIEVFQVIFFE